jgi:gamma-glutamyltranspeptidase/glutathione hydrolase
LWARKLVWAHCLPHQVYSITTGNGGLQYGNMYPLDLQDASCADSPALDVTLAQSDGIDGFDFDIFADGTSADPYLSAADANGSFLIAPCIDLSVLQALRETPLQMENAVVQAVEDYAADASTHPSAARDKDAYVVFTFHQGMPLINWKSAIQRIAQAGVKVSWVSDLESAFNDCSAFPTATVDSYINLFGAGYFWNGRYDAMFGQTASLYAAQGRNFADSLLAGADRTGARVYVDSLGTSRMRSAWNNLAAYPSNWMQLSTWNDYDELSSVNMTSDWNSTRWDLDSWYAAQFKGNPSPFSTARLYITTPKAVAMNQAAQAEAMVINATSAPVTAYIELVDGDGNALCSPVSSTIPADSTGAALVPVTLTAEPSGYYVRARAWEIDANGNVLAKVVGAPTIVYPNASPTNVRVDYYSIPASAALPGPVGLSLSTLSGKLSATIRCPSGDSALFADLIADTTQVSDTHDASPAPIAVPATQGMFYIARVIDQNKCVGYSNPIYIAR